MPNHKNPRMGNDSCISIARNARVITQSGLSEILGVPRPTISRWENDIASVTLGTLKRIADALLIDLPVLISLTKEQDLCRVLEKCDSEYLSCYAGISDYDPSCPLGTVYFDLTFYALPSVGLYELTLEDLKTIITEYQKKPDDLWGVLRKYGTLSKEVTALARYAMGDRIYALFDHKETRALLVKIAHDILFGSRCFCEYSSVLNDVDIIKTIRQVFGEPADPYRFPNQDIADELKSGFWGIPMQSTQLERLREFFCPDMSLLSCCTDATMRYFATKDGKFSQEEADQIIRQYTHIATPQELYQEPVERTITDFKEIRSDEPARTDILYGIDTYRLNGVYHTKLFNESQGTVVKEFTTDNEQEALRLHQQLLDDYTMPQFKNKQSL